MSEFRIATNNMDLQVARMLGVATVVGGCNGMVKNVNQGLGAVGLEEIGPALETISEYLAKSYTVCDTLSSSLKQIVNRYMTAERLIQMVRVLVSESEATEGNTSGDSSQSGDNDSPFVGIMYIVNSNGAAMQGHGAIILIREDGTYEYFSYGSTGANLGEELLNDAYGDGQFSSGWLDTDITNGVDANGNPIYDAYTDYIYMPISDEVGDQIYEAGNNLLANEGDYNLITNNCNMNAQLLMNGAWNHDMEGLLGEDGLAFASTEFDGVDTRPNSVFENMIADVYNNPDAYPGVVIGSFGDGEFSFSQFDDASAVQNFVTGHDPNAAPVFYGDSTYDFDNPAFHDPGQPVENFLNNFVNYLDTNYGISSDQQLYDYLMHTNPLDILGDMGNSAMDDIQSGANESIDGYQNTWNNDLDAWQHAHVSNPYVNGFIDYLQNGGNVLYDNAQSQLNQAYDQAQSTVSNYYDSTIAPGLQSIYDNTIAPFYEQNIEPYIIANYENGTFADNPGQFVANVTHDALEAPLNSAYENVNTQIDSWNNTTDSWFASAHDGVNSVTDAGRGWTDSVYANATDAVSTANATTHSWTSNFADYARQEFPQYSTQITNIQNSVETNIDNFTSNVQSNLDGFNNTVDNALDTANYYIHEGVETLHEYADEGWNTIRETAGDIRDGISDGIDSAADTIGGWVDYFIG